MPQFSDIGQNSKRGISYFQISSLSFINENCHNSGTSNDTDVKLAPVAKLEKSNTTALRKFNDDVISKNFEIIVIFGLMVNLEQSGDGSWMYGL